jgi:hypothetical protein
MAQYTFPADLEEFISVATVLEAVFPVGVVVLTEDEINPADLGLPGTWEEL